MSFQALVLSEEGKPPVLQTLDESTLPGGDVTVAVGWSGLNYKDAMVLKSLGRLVRSYPHIGGIDLAGRVVASESSQFQVGDLVLLTGWRVGEVHWGGYGELARVKAEWLLPLPKGLTMRQSMGLGTAGLTAMLALMALENYGITPDDGELLVTGASGGLGGLSVLAASQCGYSVVAATGRAEHTERLMNLGAKRIVGREALAPSDRPLLKEEWSGCIDGVGGGILSTVLASLKMRGAVASCGNAGGIALKSTVLPFLLRGVGLLGIDSAQCPVPVRQKAWARLVDILPLDVLESLLTEVELKDLPPMADTILAGQVSGRIVVRIGGDEV